MTPTRAMVEALRMEHSESCLLYERPAFCSCGANTFNAALDDVLALWPSGAGEPEMDTKNGVPPIKLGPWRRVMALRHGCQQSALYGDDGELHCKECNVDFARMEPEQIEAKWLRLGLERLHTAPPPADRTEDATAGEVNALEYCDVTTNKNGRVAYEFDLHGLDRFRDAILAAGYRRAPRSEPSDAGRLDAERLDWLEKNGQAMRSAIELEHGVFLQGATLREAIDAARAGESYVYGEHDCDSPEATCDKQCASRLSATAAPGAPPEDTV